MPDRLIEGRAVTTVPSLGDAEARLQRVREHIDELRQCGREEDADAVAFVRDLAEQSLLGRRSARSRELLTTGEAALALGISRRSVRNWVAAGRLPGVKRGVRTMIPREAILEEIERSRVQPAAATSASSSDGATLAWRRELLAALPREIAERLIELHEKLEAGQELASDEASDLVRLEREMARAAAGHLRGIIHRGRAGAA